MKRHLAILAALAALIILPPAWADDDGDSTIPPQLNWTPYPPARATVEAEMVRLIDFLVKKGVITPLEGSNPAHSRLVTTTGESPETTPEPDASDRNSR